MAAPVPSDAIRLFVQHASLVLRSFSLTSENVHAVVRICQQLDGLPLAIELAAKQLKIMSLNELAARLKTHFFELLSEGNRTALPHHQSLRATIDWSFQSLSEKEKMLLQRLSIFEVEFTWEAVTRVCGVRAGIAEDSIFEEDYTLEGIMQACGGIGMAEDEAWTLLSGLVDKSLVLVDTSGEPTRYRLLGVVRRYIQETLRESGESEKIVEAPVAA